MELIDLGFTKELESYRKENDLDSFETGRVITEHKERYIVKTAGGEFEAEITGHMRFSANSREDFPAVGDWVAMSVFDKDFAVIHNVYPRQSVLKRQAPGHKSDIQVIAANIDVAFIVQAIDRDFSINRLERYITLCNSSTITPVIILTKIDLILSEQLHSLVQSIVSRISNVPVVTISNETLDGIEAVRAFIEKGKTYCMLGSSGVGKSTLINNLSGKTLMSTGSISETANRGRHITSHRELVVLENGGILIDNPGMREVGIADSASALALTFSDISLFASGCKFKDCTHVHETGCRVIEAVQNGEVDSLAYENYLKLMRETSHFEATLEERRKKDKDFGKMIKNFKKDMSRKKY